jgi:S1-C subfamily serine protease
VKYFFSYYRNLWLLPCQIILVLASCVSSSFLFQIEGLRANDLTINSDKNSLDVKRINAIAEQITVRVLSTKALGSGTIIKKHGNIYTIITSAHVINGINSPYTIQTADGKIYLAKKVTKDDSIKYKKDIVLLQFFSSQVNYSIANIGDIDKMSIGENVYAVGFPLKTPARSGSNSSFQLNKSLAFREGKFVVLLNKPLMNGYRLAYTSSVDLGMSGGSVLNSQGEVIGINGLRDDPIWDIPMKYQDGTEPSLSIQKLISNSSLAIPIEDIAYVFK